MGLSGNSGFILFFDVVVFFFFQEEDGILDAQESRGLGDVYKRQTHDREMVDKMRRRVIALEDGQVVRDQLRGGYGEV